jgi:hypothetical protein
MHFETIEARLERIARSSKSCTTCAISASDNARGAV